jgi:hypothetical protein
MSSQVVPHQKDDVLKKLIVFALLAFGGWKYYENSVVSAPVEQRIQTQTMQAPVPNITYAAERFSCDGRQHCSQMSSRAEAVYFLRNCPNTKMDGDYDGIPCENHSKW